MQFLHFLKVLHYAQRGPIYMDNRKPSIFAKKKKRSEIKRNASALYIFKAKNFNLTLY